jgi:hypothetical protein
MTPEWTESEFAFVVDNPHLEAREVAARIGRSEGAVEAVRWGISEWPDGNISALSHIMRTYLASHPPITSR